LDIVKQRKTSVIYYGSQYILLKTILTGKIEDQEKKTNADNIHDCATLGTDATSQTLPLYSDVQKRA